MYISQVFWEERDEINARFLRMGPAEWKARQRDRVVTAAPS